MRCMVGASFVRHDGERERNNEVRGSSQKLNRGNEVAASLEVSVPSCLVEGSGSRLDLSDW